MMSSLQYRRGGDPRARRSFTLVELLLTTAIITIIASSTLFALWGVMEDAKEVRTKAQVTKIHQLIMEKWESYRTRKIPILIPTWMTPVPERYTDTNGNHQWDSGEPFPLIYDTNGNGIHDYGRAAIRVRAIREMMRMELPERITDLSWTPTPFAVPFPPSGSPPAILSLAPPTQWRTYRRRAGFSRTLPPRSSWPAQTAVPPNWTRVNQSSECLYLILATTRDGETTALDFLRDSEIGDTDEDGMLEVLDGWGRPMGFLRWAPGFATLPGPDDDWGVAGTDDDGDLVTDNRYGAGSPGEFGYFGSDDHSELQLRDVAQSPDAFDPLRVDRRWKNSSAADDPFMLYPLIYSAGRDGNFDITSDGIAGIHAYATTNPPNDPYYAAGTPLKQMGMPQSPAAEDNITNHLLGDG